ncbi:MAG: hypothetical protein GEU73_04960 [Chloroflexi bacterium]|nr:hypothetical protein [Chloroflexota bacterium]
MKPSARMFPQTATIQAATETVVDGAVTETWADLTDHVDLPAQLAQPMRQGEREIESPDGTRVEIDRYLYLQDYKPLVTEKMRAICKGVTFDIEWSDTDSHETYTRCALRLVR